MKYLSRDAVCAAGCARMQRWGCRSSCPLLCLRLCLLFPRSTQRSLGSLRIPSACGFLGCLSPQRGAFSHRGCPGWATSIPAPSRAVGVQGSCGCPRVPPWSCWRNPPQGAQESGSGMRQHHPSAAWGSSEQTSPWHRVRHSPTAAAFSSRSQAPR